MDGLNKNPLNDTDKNSTTNTQTINANDTPIKAPPPVRGHRGLSGTMHRTYRTNWC